MRLMKTRASKGNTLPSITRMALSLILSCAFAVPSAKSEELRYFAPPTSSVLSFRPVKLAGKSRLTLISPRSWEDTAKELGRTLQKTHQRFTQLFGKIPPRNTSIRLMQAKDFYERTGAPSWTNALYYRNEIMLPIATNTATEFDELVRAVKHEYTHAIIHGLSDGRCPGWLDEGLAQWAEGSENPALQPALHQWLDRNAPVALTLLRGGFTRLHSDMVPAAYAQSLFASNLLVSTYGFDAIKIYLSALRRKMSHRKAFKYSFGISNSGFERHLENVLTQWKRKRTAQNRKKIRRSLKVDNYRAAIQLPQ